MSLVETAWTTILAEPSSRNGVVARRLSPAGAIEIWAGLMRPNDTPLIFVTASTAAFRGIGDLPKAAGFDVTVEPSGTVTHSNLFLRLREQRYRPLFGVLAEDVVQQALRHSTHESALSAFVGRLRRWQSFIGRHGWDGLTTAAQQGLFAELWVLRAMALPRAGIPEAIDGWTGPTAASHDFQFPRAAVEVKSTAGGPPFHVRISSCVQLDETGVPALLLLHVALEKRAVGGESLPQAVASVRALVNDDEQASERLEERLITGGYLDVHAPLYASTKYRVLQHEFFHVHDDFPRLNLSQIPAGIHNVTYDLALEACAPWRITDQNALPMFEAPDE